MKMRKDRYEKDKDIQELTQYIAGEGNNKEKEEVFYIGSKGLDQEHDKAAKQIIKMQDRKSVV